MLMAAINNTLKERRYYTSEIIVNSNGRVLNADKEFCEIINCKSPNGIINSILLDFIADSNKKSVVNAFIDTFYGHQQGKLFEVKMIDNQGVEIDVTFNFFPIKSSNGEKSTLLIRKKIF